MKGLSGVRQVYGQQITSNWFEHRKCPATQYNNYSGYDLRMTLTFLINMCISDGPPLLFTIHRLYLDLMLCGMEPVKFLFYILIFVTKIIITDYKNTKLNIIIIIMY